MGVEMIAPPHPRRSRKTQDGRPLRRYRRRWHIERLFAWMLRFRKLVTRYERHARNFLGFAKLACIVILLRQPIFNWRSANPERLLRTGLSDAL